MEGGCPKGRGLVEDERERSQPPALRATSFQRKEGECLFPASSFRAKARNLFRSRSGEGCEECGERETPYFLRLGSEEGECHFPIAKPSPPHIVISSESEKSFSFAVRRGCEGSGEREKPCFMRLGSTVLHADGITKENGNGERKRSLGCARDDETGEAHLTLFFQPTAVSQPPPLRGTFP